MHFFDTYSSNTLAGSANQHFFIAEKGKHTGRVFYKIFKEGEFNYSILFSNIIDGTYGLGDVSHKNYICDSWTIHSARVAKWDKNTDFTDMFDGDNSSRINNTDAEFLPLTFDGSPLKIVHPGEIFSSDPVLMSFEKDDYLCLEITFEGREIPYHEESVLPVFRKTENGWEYNREMPFASMVGADIKSKAKIAFVGDSITQGIGAGYNTYKHWNAVFSEKLGDEYSYWNLGIGYARAGDMASDGAWGYKAKQNDIIFVCYGVNDILQGHTVSDVKRDLTAIIDNFKKLGKKVILQTVPPFTYSPECTERWKEVNSIIKNELSEKVDFVFDNAPILQVQGKPGVPMYEAHPNEQGCVLWGEALYEELKAVIGELL